VKGIVPGGPMSKTFGLMPGDTILGVGELTFRGLIDEEMAEAKVFEAKFYKKPLIVKRGGQEIQLAPH
jgi:hypothetical protein